MEHLCSVCNKKAFYFCGHGCETPYCGESCAKAVYNVHKEGCADLIEWNPFHRQQHHGHIYRSANEMYHHFTLQNSHPPSVLTKVATVLSSLESLPTNQRHNQINMFVQAVSMVYQNHPDKFPAGSQQLQQLTAYQQQAHHIR
jgi:hypothetical protein